MSSGRWEERCRGWFLGFLFGLLVGESCIYDGKNWVGLRGEGVWGVAWETFLWKR